MKSLHFLLLCFLFHCIATAPTYGALSQTSTDHPKKAVRVDKETLFPIIKEFLEALQKGDIEAAYNNFTTQQFKQDTSLDKFKALVASEAVLSKNKLFQHHSFYIEDEVATFEGDLISDDGDTVAAEIDLEQENQQWKIMGLQLYQPGTTTLPDNP